MNRSLWEQISTLVLALVLALVVWVVAVNEADPAVEKAYAQPLTVELVNLSPELILVGPLLTQTTALIRAPQSVWTTLTTEEIRLYVDLSGMTPGTHELPITWQLAKSIIEITHLTPAVVRVNLEKRALSELPVRVKQTGDPAPGYQAGAVELATTTVTISGPASAVDRVSETLAQISLADLKETLSVDVPLTPVDATGKVVPGVTLSPTVTHITVPVAQKEGFRNVSVRLVITGQVQAGYWVTNIVIAPPAVTVSSADPLKVNDLPGFVETQPLDLQGKSDDIVTRVPLALPAGITAVGEQSVLVQVNIAAIESSLTLPRLMLEVQGLAPGLAVKLSPEAVDVLLSGPLSVLERLEPEEARIALDLTNLGVGTYQLTPKVIQLPEKLRIENILPSQIEVVLTAATPTTLPTQTPASTPKP